jgi:hypothetical protein
MYSQIVLTLRGWPGKPGHDGEAPSTSESLGSARDQQLTLQEPGISCRKSETKLGLPYEQSCAFALQDRWSPLRDANAGEKGTKKKPPAKIPYNPLISLDSDERIQGNPNKSNGHKVGVSL